MAEFELSRISNDTLKERVHRELRYALMAGRFKPGQQLTVKAVAEAMNVGTMPVRESLPLLAADGGLEILPNRSVRVPLPSLDEIRDIFAIRSRVEGLAARRAALHRTAEQLRRIEELCRSMDQAVEKHATAADLLDLNIGFMFAVYEAAGSHHLTAIIETLWLKTGPLLAYRVADAPSARRTSDADREADRTLVQALRSGRAAGAERALRRILAMSLAWYESNYEGLMAPDARGDAGRTSAGRRQSTGTRTARPVLPDS